MAILKTLGRQRETNISTLQDPQKEGSWFQGKDEYKGWKSNNKKEEKEEKVKDNALMSTLSKSEILRRKSDFRIIFSSGGRILGRWMAIYFLPAPERKVGFAVSSKVSTKALRNRIKRRLRELYRLNKEKFPERGRIVVFGYKNAGDCSFSLLESDLLGILKKLRDCWRGEEESCT